MTEQAERPLQTEGIVVTRAISAYGAAIALIAMAISPGTAQSDSEPIPPYITIGQVTANGSGCPAGTTAVNWAPDRRSFTVTYSAFVAESGPGISVLRNRRNCQVNFQVIIPSGFTYAIAKTDFRGFANLAAGVTATEEANYYFGGESPNAYSRNYVRGPYNNNWAFTDTGEVIATAYHPCGIKPIFNINQSLRVSSSPTSVSYITMDSTDSSFSTVYYVSWKKCTA